MKKKNITIEEVTRWKTNNNNRLNQLQIKSNYEEYKLLKMIVTEILQKRKGNPEKELVCQLSNSKENTLYMDESVPNLNVPKEEKKIQTILKITTPVPQGMT